MSTSINADKLLEQLEQLRREVLRDAQDAMRITVAASYKDAKSTTAFKDRTGDLRNSIHAEVTLSGNSVTGKLSAESKHARFVESGTRPHVIEARSGNMLRFVSGDRVIFRRRVNHPGTKETKFMGQAADVGEKTLEYASESLTDASILKFNSSG